MPIELPFTQFPPPALQQSTIESGDATTSFKLGFPENPILIGIDCIEADSKFELGFAQHSILVENRDTLPQGGDTEAESDCWASPGAEPSIGCEPAIPHDLRARAQQQNGG